MKALEKTRKSLIPSKSETQSKTKIATIAFDLVKKHSAKYSEIVDVQFGGSFAKGTWLVRKADIDIFVKFKESTTEKKFAQIAEKIGFDSMSKFKPYVRYSEHPYVEAIIKDTKVNVVPCYNVKKGQWKSSADRSPFHTQFMQESLSENMKNEVRLLKAFLKSHRIYGAEIAKQGFSGYVTEVLILNFGSFENVVKSIAKIKQNQVIGNTTKKFDTPIVIIDPIDSNRNLAAAISTENIGKFILTCRAFIANPSNSFFSYKMTKAEKEWENILTVKFSFKKRSPDIIWGQVKRAATSMATQLELGGFKVFRSAGFTDEKKDAYLFFLLEGIEISKSHLKKGPNFFNQSDSEKFISKNIKKTELMWIDNDARIVSLEKRKSNNAEKFMRDLLKNVKKSGIPTGLQDDVKRGFKIFSGSKKLAKSIKEQVNDLVLTNEKIFYSN